MTEFFLKENFFKFHNLPFPPSRALLWQFNQEFEEADEETEDTQKAAGF